MKKIFLFFALCITLILGGCSDSFLNQDPPLYASEAEVFGDKTRINSALNGLYAAFKNASGESFMGGKVYLVFDNRGDDIVNIGNNNVTLFSTFNMEVGITSAENVDTWRVAYFAINKANLFLKSLEKSKDVAGTDYDRYRQEALFIRAMSYFYLNNLYAVPYSVNPDAKSVPLRLNGESDTSNNKMKRSTVTEVYNQILEDLSDISALSTSTNTEDAVTHATQAAANMLKMRVYMALGQWANAIAAGEAITGYELTDDVTAIYNTPYFTKETIFSLPMRDNNVPNTQQSLAEYYFDGRIMLIDADNGIMSKANYSLANDKRIVNFKGDGNILKKFTDGKTKLQWVPIFRYAETLLNLAECYANTSGKEAEAIAALKQVRVRSVESGDLLDIDNLTGDALKEAIYNEKRLEFIGEGMRSIDIMRRGENFVKTLVGGILTVTPSETNYIWPIPQSERLINSDWDQ